MKEEDDVCVGIERIELWRVVGFAPELGLIVVENPETGFREGRYLSTGAKVCLKDNKNLEVWDWCRDAQGNQCHSLVKVYEFCTPEPSIFVQERISRSVDI